MREDVSFRTAVFLLVLRGLHRPQKTQEGFFSLGSPLVNACVLQDLGKHKPRFFFDNFQSIFCRDVVFAAETFRPGGVFFRQLAGVEVLASGQGVRDGGKLRLQTGGQNRKAHNLDQSDIFFLDVVQLVMRMIEAERVLVRCEVVPKNQVQLILFAPAAGNRRDRIMRSVVRFRV